MVVFHKNHALLLGLAGFIYLIFFFYQQDTFSLLLQEQYSDVTPVQNDSLYRILIKKIVPIKHYFQFMDSVVARYDSLTSYNLTEHLLVRANPWIIDTLHNTDYYLMKERGFTVFDQKEMVVLDAGKMLEVPAFAKAEKLQAALQQTYIDINIPEFKLRIYQDTVLLHEFPIRVGRNEKKYLRMGDRITDLRTISGSGTVVSYEKFPDYYNPVNGYQYYSTSRDDGKSTQLPQIPFLETRINGVRNGQLIHPTTNPISLGKAYSNGCIGTSEAAAWVIYYHAPLGTEVKIRYDLFITNSSGEKEILADIYGYLKK